MCFLNEMLKTGSSGGNALASPWRELLLSTEKHSHSRAIQIENKASYTRVAMDLDSWSEHHRFRSQKWHFSCHYILLNRDWTEDYSNVDLPECQTITLWSFVCSFKYLQVSHPGNSFAHEKLSLFTMYNNYFGREIKKWRPPLTVFEVLGLLLLRRHNIDKSPTTMQLMSLHHC